MIEAVGVPQTFELCTNSCAPAGTSPTSECTASRRLALAWSTNSTLTLLRMVESGRIDGERFITRRFGLDEVERAYEVFENTGAQGGAGPVTATTEHPTVAAWCGSRAGRRCEAIGDRHDTHSTSQATHGKASR